MTKTDVPVTPLTGTSADLRRGRGSGPEDTFPARAKLEVSLPSEDKDAVLVLDGQYERRLAGGDEVHFTGSQHRARFVRFSSHFYGRLRERLVR